MESKIKIAIALVLTAVITLGAVAIISAAYAASRQSSYQTAYGNSAPYSGHNDQVGQMQLPYGNSYPQSGYGSGNQPGYGSYGGMGQGGMMGGW